ncbi:hypothetical protein CU633_01730 [Bacillus sp. V3-13]|uniref:nuclease-related domain-containing protein n=1 Tax=Bacillus sp. V3-13 TaxID=2053728 RepID=UPI000C756D3E|nr:nuclease-related domain-containing protein [Bacillus sp. V3-13]PLR79116.1 hypothetical protein CU633_01730 [Bacillus sp. V3-13]
MGQLIKLQDYVSRYEQNIFLYPSRFVRLKKQQWEKLLLNWETDAGENDDQSAAWLEDDRKPLFHKIKGFLRIADKETETETIVEADTDAGADSDEDGGMLFTPSLPAKPETVEDLKKHFLDQLFRFQMKWASTTILEKSDVEQKFYYDERLKFFLQRFPDTHLVLYRPVFLLKQAPVEVESVLIGPSEVLCITFLEAEENAVFTGSKERFWKKRHQMKEQKILNPLLALNRTEKIVKKVLELYEIDLPVQKIVLLRNGYINFPSAPYDIRLIEKRNFDEWFQSMRRQRSPLKAQQLKAAQALLEYCQTSSMRRMEWDISDEK